MWTIKEVLDQSRMIIIAASRHLHMQEVLQHPLGLLPFSLATSSGLPRKTNKAQLGRELERLIEPTTHITSPSVYLIDGMALVQKLKVSDHMTFGQIADAALSRVLQEGGNSKRIDVVFDAYNAISIKPAEREQRGEGESVTFKNLTKQLSFHRRTRTCACYAFRLRMQSLFPFFNDAFRSTMPGISISAR